MTTACVPWCTEHLEFSCTHDLPAADGNAETWVGVEVDFVGSETLRFVNVPGGNFTPAEAREYAMRLLTAAALAELKRPDGSPDNARQC